MDIQSVVYGIGLGMMLAFITSILAIHLKVKNQNESIHLYKILFILLFLSIIVAVTGKHLM